MTGYILKATVEPSIAENLFFKLSRIAYSKPLAVKSTTKSKALTERVITLEVHGESTVIESALSETRAYLGSASDIIAQKKLPTNTLEVELSVV